MGVKNPEGSKGGGGGSGRSGRGGGENANQDVGGGEEGGGGEEEWDAGEAHYEADAEEVMREDVCTGNNNERVGRWGG